MNLRDNSWDLAGGFFPTIDDIIDKEPKLPKIRLPGRSPFKKSKDYYPYIERDGTKTYRPYHCRYIND